jgi:hypothetical protein
MDWAVIAAHLPPTPQTPLAQELMTMMVIRLKTLLAWHYVINP